MNGRAIPDCGIMVSSNDSDTCLIAFGGIYDPPDMPPFEWLRISEGLPAVRVLARDLDKVWYQSGIRGLGDSIASTADAFRVLLEDHGVTRTVCFGASAGGFAAILFGSLIGADVVHAIVPQTNLTQSFFERNNLTTYAFAPGSTLWPETPPERNLDLRIPVAETGVPVNVYYSPGRRYDACHAQNLAGLPNVTLHPRQGTDHALTRKMRDSGELREILEASVS